MSQHDDNNSYLSDDVLMHISDDVLMSKIDDDNISVASNSSEDELYHIGESPYYYLSNGFLKKFRIDKDMNEYKSTIINEKINKLDLINKIDFLYFCGKYRPTRNRNIDNIPKEIIELVLNDRVINRKKDDTIQAMYISDLDYESDFDIDSYVNANT